MTKPDNTINRPLSYGLESAAASQSAKVSHIEWEVQTAAPTIAFLAALFDWEFRAFSEHYYWAEDNAGLKIGLLEKPSPALAAACSVFISVDAITDSLELALQLGGQLVEPKTAIADYGYWAKLREPGGNLIGLFEAA